MQCLDDAVKLASYYPKEGVVSLWILDYINVSYYIITAFWLAYLR